MEIAKLGERATAVLHIVDNKRRAYTQPVERLICELVSESTGEKIDCSVKKTEASGQYEISYQATSRGRHQLHIVLEGKHIIGSPFPVLVKIPFPDKALMAITGGQTDSGEWHSLSWPWGVAINSKGNIVVAEYGGERNCVSVINPAEPEKVIKLLYSNRPVGVAVDDEDNILVTDVGNNRIQKFTSDGILATPDNLGLNWPAGIAIHPRSKKLYVADNNNHCIKILNSSDLTFFNSFGSYGSGAGQVNWPFDVAFDSTGYVYVADYGNNRIQVFTAEGTFVTMFGRYGSGYGELNGPIGIYIDSEDVVYVSELGNNRVSLFTREGTFLKSFGSRGSQLGQFNGPRGIALDKEENVYVADLDNNRIQKF